MSRVRWWRRLVPPLLSAVVLMAGSAAAAQAAYPASVDVNTTAFNPPCDGDPNFIVPKMQTAAVAEFYVGYLGVQWDGDEWIFEQRYWNALANGKSVGAAFDVAMLGAFNHAGFDADWWGTYQWSGVAGPWTTCKLCS